MAIFMPRPRIRPLVDRSAVQGLRAARKRGPSESTSLAKISNRSPQPEISTASSWRRCASMADGSVDVSIALSLIGLPVRAADAGDHVSDVLGGCGHLGGWAVCRDLQPGPIDDEGRRQTISSDAAVGRKDVGFSGYRREVDSIALDLKGRITGMRGDFRCLTG